MYNVLVCDDDKEIVEAIDIYLTKEGYNVIKAYDGMEAVERLKRKWRDCEYVSKVWRKKYGGIFF